MKSTDRSRLSVFWGLVIFLVVCFVVPRVFFQMKYAMLEIRYFGGFILMGGFFLYVLFKLGRKRQE